jgi:hypothetical protein
MPRKRRLNNITTISLSEDTKQLVDILVNELQSINTKCTGEVKKLTINDVIRWLLKNDRVEKILKKYDKKVELDFSVVI